MIAGWMLVLTVAAVNWMAVARGWKKVEQFAKPLTIAALFLILLRGLVGAKFTPMPLILFGVGLFFSLAGDIFLLVSYSRSSNRWFMIGLVAFLLAHASYIAGLNIPLPGGSPFWSLGVAILLSLTASRILRRIVAGVRLKRLARMVAPVMIYGIVITLMLLSALLTLYRSDWRTTAAGLVALGASLFYFSDIILAWNRYVTPIQNGRVINIVAYQLGQMALVAGALIQFGK